MWRINTQNFHDMIESSLAKRIEEIIYQNPHLYTWLIHVNARQFQDLGFNYVMICAESHVLFNQEAMKRWLDTAKRTSTQRKDLLHFQDKTAP